MKKLGIALILIALLSLTKPLFGVVLPLVKWVDLIGQAVSEFIRSVIGFVFAASPGRDFDGYFVHGLRGFLFVIGLWLCLRKPPPPNPLSQKQWRRFKMIRRGYASLWILGILVLLAGLDNLLVGKRALIVSHNGSWHFPFLLDSPILGKTFGVEPADAETDYRRLKETFAEEGKGNWVLMPVVPYDSEGDAPPVIEKLNEKDGKYYALGDTKPYTGNAYSHYRGQPEMRRREYRLKDGIFHGDAVGKDRQGTLVEKLTYQAGQEVTRQVLAPETDFAALDAAAGKELHRLLYAPTAPSIHQRHFLGTDSGGNDLLAVAYGGFQIIVGTSTFYVILVYLIGITIGCIMGYFGSWVDLCGQRLVEIWIAIPILMVVMLIRSVMQAPSVLTVVSLLVAFGWMGIAAYMRTGAYKEKARDYVAAARLQGAGTARIIFKHVVPNILSIIVTLIPFTIDGLIFSLTSLDFLGFGLPAGKPSWGHILREGSDNLHAPWIVLTGFGVLVTVLLLVTFVGEAVREAFDPKKFTTYR